MASKLSVAWLQAAPRRAYPIAKLVFLTPRTSKRGVKYGWSTKSPPRKIIDPYNDPATGLPALSIGPIAALKRKERTTPLRTGVLATKQGMMAVFDEATGQRVAATVLQLDQVQVLATRTPEQHGYWGVQIGMGSRRPKNVTNALLGYYEAKGVAPKEQLADFHVRNPDGLLPVGLPIMPDWFMVGQYVDTRSNSKGKGFAGAMKRWGFSGQEASHGNSLNHRTIGSAGGSQGSGSRVLPGKKMPGRMGNEQKTVQNLRVLRVDNDMGTILVAGHVAGPKGCVVKVQDAIKKPPPSQEHIDAANAALRERMPDVEKRLEGARTRHLDMKRARRESSSHATEAF